MGKSRKTHYHSTVSRRDFMKMLGVGTAVGGTASMAPFVDVDDMMSRSQAVSVQPWWVKEVDEPTVEVDWENYERFNQDNNAFAIAGQILGQDRVKEIFANRAKQDREGAINSTPNLTTRDQALVASQWGRRNVEVSFLGDPLTDTPEERGIPKWEGTPEENARMIRVAARWFGASEAGFVKVTERTKKLFWASKGGQEYVFEDVGEPYETETKKVFPNKDLWAIVYTVPQSMILTQRASQYGGFGTPVGNAYAKCKFIENRMVDFIHALGYQHMGGGTTGIGPSPAWGVMAGLGELSRTNRLVSPKYGNAVRTNLVMITDLPLAESKPIDAGIWKFCHTCKKCGELCPSDAICMDDEPSWETVSICNTYGVKAFHDDGVKCFEQLMGHGCTICHAVCPYNKMDEAVVHDLVKMTIAKAPAFNGVIRNLDDAFGYGYQPNGEDFWEMDHDEFPLYGLDPSRS